MLHVSEQSTGRLSDAWRFCVGTGRFELALRRHTPVVDAPPPWLSDDRLLGKEVGA